MTKTPQDLALLLSHAIAHGQGLSLRLDGTSPTEGYAVGLQSYEMRLVTHKWDLVREWTKRACQDLSGIVSLDLVLGAWLDGDHIYFDVAQIIRDRDEAIAQGHEQEQLAIFDIAKGEEIRLDEACNPCDPTDCPTRVLCPHYQKTRLDDKCPGGFPVGEPCGNCDKCP